MTSKADQANERHHRGYNCAQAVACAYAEELGVDEQAVFRACEGLGLGMGGMQGTCGAVSGACVAAGLANSDGDLDHPASKRDTYKLSREICNRFLEKNGSLTCGVLKGQTGGPVLRACDDCVRDAATILEDVVFSDGETPQK